MGIANMSEAFARVPAEQPKNTHFRVFQDRNGSPSFDRVEHIPDPPPTMATFTGKLITPAKFGQKCIYEVTRPVGVIRTGTSPRIEEAYKIFRLDYVTDPKVTSGGVDQWDLTLVYKNSPPRTITVNMCLDGGTDTTDGPVVQDGKT